MIAISSVLLASIGIGLIAVEVFLFSFFLMFIGISCLIVALFHHFIPFEILWSQLIVVSVISIALVFVFRTRLKAIFKKGEKEINQNFLQEGGSGVIKNDMVFFKGVYFKVDGNKKYKEDENVEVIKTIKNIAYLK